MGARLRARDGREVAVRLALDASTPGAELAAEGSWLEVEGSWRAGSGAGFADPPLVDVTLLRAPSRIPDRFEG